MTRASEPMTRRVLVAAPELSIDAAWSIMERERFRHLPVVRNGLLLGMLSDRDILLRSELREDQVVTRGIVGEAMTPAPYVCGPDTDVVHLVRTMTEKKIDAVPVVNHADQLVGLVTSTDLMLLLITLDEARHPIPFEFELEIATAEVSA
ncbi:MAG: CBS domain-containing protein [Myxococcota bacterium]